jgi:hypothetical protein
MTVSSGPAVLPGRTRAVGTSVNVAEIAPVSLIPFVVITFQIIAVERASG